MPIRRVLLLGRVKRIPSLVQVIFPKTAVSEMGYFAICLDTENNALGIWEDNKKAKQGKRVIFRAGPTIKEERDEKWRGNVRKKKANHES